MALNSLYTTLQFRLSSIMLLFILASGTLSSGRKLSNFTEVKTGVREFFDSNPKKWYQQLVERWFTTANRNGLF